MKKQKKHLSTQSTTIPKGWVPVFTGKLADQRFNNWHLYIRGIENTPRKGGVCYRENMELLLDQAHEILATNAKR